MEGLANNFQIALSNFAANPAVQGFSDWVINFNFLGLDLSRYPSEVWGPLNALLVGQVSPQLVGDAAAFADSRAIGSNLMDAQ